MIRKLQKEVDLLKSELQELMSSKENARKAYEKYRKEKEEEIRELQDVLDRRSVLLESNSSYQEDSEGESDIDHMFLEHMFRDQ